MTSKLAFTFIVLLMSANAHAKMCTLTATTDGSSHIITIEGPSNNITRVASPFRSTEEALYTLDKKVAEGSCTEVQALDCEIKESNYQGPLFDIQIIEDRVPKSRSGLINRKKLTDYMRSFEYANMILAKMRNSKVCK